MMQDQTLRDTGALVAIAATAAPLVGELLERSLDKRRAGEGAKAGALTVAPVAGTIAFFYYRSGSGKKDVLTGTALYAALGAGAGAMFGALLSLAYGD